MPITIVCPDCDAKIRAPDSVQNKPVKCPKCGAQFTAAASADGMPSSAPTMEAMSVAPIEPAPAAAPTMPAGPARETMWAAVAQTPADNRPAPAPPAPLPEPLSPPDRSNNVLVDFLLFRKMVAPVLIQVLFWIGLIGCIVVGGLQFAVVLTLLNAGQPFGRVIGPLLSTLTVWFLGPVFLRVNCEVLILFFRMHEALTEIKNAKEKRRE
jgi:predicted Zn finger-like uncharacterized protein